MVDNSSIKDSNKEVSSISRDIEFSYINDGNLSSETVIILGESF
jgi:hypothetical protein